MTALTALKNQKANDNLVVGIFVMYTPEVDTYSSEGRNKSTLLREEVIMNE
ncbi:MAG TPA: hypothetical protein VIH52_03050 [Candidatus Nanoarchaeia archaeon]|nr:hypothetical protein [uncultured archaeon]